MEIPSSLSAFGADPSLLSGGVANVGSMSESEGLEAAAKQFEAIFVRQYLSESLAPMLEGALGQQGPGSEIYRYYFVSAMADKMSESGDFGISSALQAQLARPEPADNLKTDSDK